MSCQTCNTCESEQQSIQPETPTVAIDQVSDTWIQITRHVNDPYTSILTYVSEDGSTWYAVATYCSSHGYSCTLNGDYMLISQLPTGKTLWFKAAGTRNGYTSPYSNIVSATCGNTVYTNYSISLDSAVNVQMSLSDPPQDDISGTWANATRERVRQYLDPNNYCNGGYKYQFLNLSIPAGVSVSQMNAYLSNKGILAGKGSSFINAANSYGVSEIYLAAHAALETGNGTSQLATGVVVNGVTVYNMYGIHAFDYDPVGCGSQYAYQMGWTTPELAIEGGANWISQDFINNSTYRQNTLYKMRWNPASPGSHQYATDVGWAVKQAPSIENMYSNFPQATKKFDIPVYQ